MEILSPYSKEILLLQDFSIKNVSRGEEIMISNNIDAENSI